MALHATLRVLCVGAIYSLSALALVACSGSIGDGEVAGSGASTDDTGSPGNAADSGSNADGGGPTTDSGKPADTGASPGSDTATPPPTDTGTLPPDDTATPPPVDTGTTPPPDATSSDPFATARDVCVKKINEYRATLSLAPLAGWTSAEPCVDDEARKDSVSGKAHSAFGSCGESAQNECPNYPGSPESGIVTCLGQMWAEGPGADFATHGHYINMTSTSYTAVACGFFVTASGSWWGAQDFH